MLARYSRQKNNKKFFMRQAIHAKNEFQNIRK